jgi:hypothetical protein
MCIDYETEKADKVHMRCRAINRQTVKIVITHSPSQCNFCYIFVFFATCFGHSQPFKMVFGSESFHTALVGIPCYKKSCIVTDCL